MAGEVIIAGAGPGNPLLISLQLLEEMQRADVIVYDRLIHRGILKFARRDAEFIFAGKEAKKHYLKQYEINDLLVEKAMEGKRVLRIQGGDPVIFGRAGEELDRLTEAGIRFRLIPGITAGVAVPEFAGIPLTHRKVTSSVMFFTGHEDPDKDESAIDWELIAGYSGTLVMFMGVSNLSNIMNKLISLGKSPETPVALIRRGTFYDQKVIYGTLSDIAERARREGITPPAITVIGDVVRYGKKNGWFENLPLAGKKVVVLRDEGDALDLAREIWMAGGEAVIFPVIRFQKLDFFDEIGDLCDFSSSSEEYVVFTSPRGVRFFFEELRNRGRDVRCVGLRKFAAIGPSTAAELQKYGILPDIVPEEYVAESLAEALLKERPRRVFLLRARRARDTLVDRLFSGGVYVKVVPVYETLQVEHSPEDVEELKDAHYFLFTSSSTVDNLISILGDPSPLEGRAVSIGPVTTSTLKKYGITPVVESKVHHIEGLLAALKDFVVNEKGGV